MPDLRRQRLLSWRAVRHFLAYLRPRFHPDDMQTDGLVAEWRERLQDQTTITAGGPGTSRRGRVPAAAAS